MKTVVSWTYKKDPSMPLKTADGVEIVPGMTVYRNTFYGGHGVESHTISSINQWWWRSNPPSDFYSTKLGALNASRALMLQHLAELDARIALETKENVDMKLIGRISEVSPTSESDCSVIFKLTYSDAASGQVSRDFSGSLALRLPKALVKDYKLGDLFTVVLEIADPLSPP